MFLGIYYRAALNVSSLVTLYAPTHFQAIAQAARLLFELSVDVHLLDLIADAPAKMAAFSDVELLKAAQDGVTVADGDELQTELALWRAFISEKEEAIHARRSSLWPPGRLTHWSGINQLKDRVALLPIRYATLHSRNYRLLSWYAHAGLTGISMDAAGYAAIAAKSLGVAAECYVNILRSIIAELHLEKAVEGIQKKMEYAQLLAFADSEATAEGLRREILG
ncbi:MAG TPA: hypothetical protein VF618_17305 [Thermoanaerobaculia bacterium]